mmetsp:Transcript_51148/g.155537  ORF Transcript_51148/g.155537 Transcript_51148/m.155537 type:complete len:216 (+) Transcript_51148:233-880(+)
MVGHLGVQSRSATFADSLTKEARPELHGPAGRGAARARPHRGVLPVARAMGQGAHRHVVCVPRDLGAPPRIVGGAVRGALVGDRGPGDGELGPRGARGPGHRREARPACHAVAKEGSCESAGVGGGPRAAADHGAAAGPLRDAVRPEAPRAERRRLFPSAVAARQAHTLGAEGVPRSASLRPRARLPGEFVRHAPHEKQHCVAVPGRHLPVLDLQ